MKKNILLVLLVTFLFPLSARMYLDVSYENNRPVEKDNLYFLDMAYINNVADIENCTDSKVYTYYRNEKGKWVKLYPIKPGKKLTIEKKKFTKLEYLCIQYTGKSDKHWDFKFEGDDNFLLIKFGSFYNEEGNNKLDNEGYVPTLEEGPWKGRAFNEIAIDVIEKNTNDIPIIINKLYTSIPNSAGGVDVCIDFMNLSEKTLKYVYFDVLPINRVNDVAVCEVTGESVKTLKMTNFVKQYEIYRGYWENTWYNNTISFPIISNIRIVYADNSETSIELNDDNIKDIIIDTPLKLDLYKDENIELSLSQYSGDSYISLFTKKRLNTFNIVFNTKPKKDNGKIFDKIEFDLNEADKEYGNQKIKMNPRELQLLFETINIEIKYKFLGEDESIVKITDYESLSELQDFAYLMYNLHK